MNFSIFIITLYKTCTILSILLIINRTRWSKSVFKKSKPTKNDYFIISIIYTLLAVCSIYLPFEEYGSKLSIVRTIIISGGIIFSYEVGIISSILVSFFIAISSRFDNTVMLQIIGILSAGILSSLINKMVIKFNVNRNYKWIIGILTGIIVQCVYLFQIYVYTYLVGNTEMFLGIDLYSFNISMCLAQIPIGIFISVNQYIAKEKKSTYIEQLKGELNKAKLEVLQSQINPNYLFNSLDLIGLLADSDPDISRELTVALSKYIRYNLDLYGEYVTIKEELEHIKNYIYIQKTRFNDKFDISYDIDEVTEKKIPSLIIYLLIEVILENYILQTNKKGRISLHIKRNLKNKIKISIEYSGEIQYHELISDHKENGNNKDGLSSINERLMMIYGEGLSIKKLESGAKFEFYI